MFESIRIYSALSASLRGFRRIRNRYCVFRLSNCHGGLRYTYESSSSTRKEPKFYKFESAGTLELSSPAMCGESKMTEHRLSAPEIESKVASLLYEAGFETHPFKIGWYNEQVSEAFVLQYPADTLAFIVVSTPEMFDKAFKPFILRQSCNGVRDPIDECMMHYLNLVKKEFPEGEVDAFHDFELHHNRRPKVLVQTAGHVAGAAYYYQQSDVEGNPWGKKKMFGVSIHPKYGGWFAFRGVIIFKNVLHPDLARKPAPDVVNTPELRKELLERFNYNWQDWSFRNIVPSASQYSEEQKLYFETKPADRKKLIATMFTPESCDMAEEVLEM